MKRMQPKRRKVNKPRSSRRSAKKKFVQPTTMEGFFAMPRQYQELGPTLVR